MLSSIHPLGERAKNNSYALTASSFVVGSVIGAAAIGAVAGLGAWALSTVVDEASAAVVFGVAALGASVAEWRGIRLPSWRRQVSEDWLVTYRGWVYGGGFGIQLGAGVLTIITSAAVPLAVLAALLTDSAVASVAICVSFGLARGLSILAVAGVRSSEQLLAFHQRLQARAGRVRAVASSALALTGVAVLAAGSL